MEKYSKIIILTDSYNIDKEDILVIKDDVTLIDDVHILVNDITYSFDYLIFTNTSKIKNFKKTNILHENGIPVTNFFYQTTYENIYYTLEELINIALDNIIDSNL